MMKRINKKTMVIGIVIFVLLILFCIWQFIRSSTTIFCPQYTSSTQIPYSEADSVLKAISLSCITYGCESVEDLSGTVNEVIDNNDLGILKENFGIKRTDESDATTALFNATEFIRSYIGDFRIYSSLKDEKSSFFGIACCDDENKCIWVNYSGSVSLKDCVACASLVLNPGFSAQEKAAFKLFRTVMESDEVMNQSYQVIASGHSLGGALASMVSYMSGCNAVTINGADGVAIDKMNSIIGKEPKEYMISNYMTSPKNGHFSIMDVVQRLTFFGSYKSVNYHIYKENGLTLDTHCIFSFITFENDNYTNPTLQEALDL